MTVLGGRLDRAELIDEGGHDPEELARSMRHVATVNRLLGGTRAMRRHLAPLRRDRSDAWVLDVGTANGRVLRNLVDWAREGGARWRGVGLDLRIQMLDAEDGGDGGFQAVADRAEGRPEAAATDTPAAPAPPPVSWVQGDGLALPFADGCFDAVLCTLTLHHFRDEDAVRLVREMGRVSRNLVLVNDLERSLPNYLGARMLAATWWRRNRLTRHDGPLSVLRSFTREELMETGRAAGLANPRVVRHFPFRLVLEGRE